MKRFFLSTLMLSMLAAFAAAAPGSGIDTQFIDNAVRAQDDFFSYLNGKWLTTTQIPADRARWSTFDQLRDDTLSQLRTVIETAVQEKKKSPGSDVQKIADFYTSFMDTEKLDQLGLSPLASELSRIRAVADKKALPALIAHLRRIGVRTPYDIYVSVDPRDPSQYAVELAQDGLGLPDRDFYLRGDIAQLASVKARYEAHIAKVLGMAGHPQAEADAKAIVALETALAAAQWSKVDNRDPLKTYNKTRIADLSSLAPGYDWDQAMAEAGLAGRVDAVIVNQPSYLAGFVKALADTDVASWKAYFEWQLLRQASPYLSAPFADADFAFFGRALTGVSEPRPRWKRGMTLVERSIGDALGRVYVARYFPPERKASLQLLTANLMAAYKTSIDALDWMSPGTRKEAQSKLAKLSLKVAYPDKWRNYSKLSIAPNDLMGNVWRAADFDYTFDLNKLGKPVDRGEWAMSPMTINSYSNPVLNEIVFPAAVLQPPFFNAGADDAVNYGAIGAMIGHQICYGFDEQGSWYDSDGKLRSWWSKEDYARFKARTEPMVKQYANYSPLPGYRVNGSLTLGANIADNCGLTVAYRAYQLSLKGKPAPVIDGLTGAQRFFMGYGQVWRSKVRDQQQIVLLKTDPHAPNQFRTNGPLLNHPAFYDAFDVKPGDKMYVPPEQRISVW